MHVEGKLGDPNARLRPNKDLPRLLRSMATGTVSQDAGYDILLIAAAKDLERCRAALELLAHPDNWRQVSYLEAWNGKRTAREFAEAILQGEGLDLKPEDKT